MNRKILQWAAAAALAAVLTACGGGGDGSAPATSTTPAGATSVGTVTGFGSVFVDGERIDDSKARIEVEDADGSTRLAELKLGQSVEVEHDGDLSASHIRIDAGLVGMVSAKDGTAGTLVVAGQTVLVNADPAAGPVTVFDSPYTSLADVQVGDLVEVHGVPVLDSATGKYIVQATRIERTAGPVAYLRVAGFVQGLDTTKKVFTLGNLTIDYTNAKLRPSADALADGLHVRVWIDASAPITTTNPVPAKFVSIDHRRHSDRVEARVGGVIEHWDATAKTFEINGIRVVAGAAKILPVGKALADLADGLYVRVRGSFAADGTLVASSIVLRRFEFDFEVELHGTITDFVSLADFKVRGVPVDASTAKVELSTCQAGITALADGLFVEVEGKLSVTTGPKLIAVEVKCDQPRTGLSIVERRGTASKVDASARTFTLTPTASEHASSVSTTPVAVQWTEKTYFRGVEPTTLEGKTVEVAGVLDSTAKLLTAVAIKLED